MKSFTPRTKGDTMNSNEKKTDPAMIQKLALALPLHDGETILWYREAAHGYELRVRTTHGDEVMHDVYAHGPMQGRPLSHWLAPRPADRVEQIYESLKWNDRMTPGRTPWQTLRRRAEEMAAAERAKLHARIAAEDAKRRDADWRRLDEI